VTAPAWEASFAVERYFVAPHTLESYSKMPF
jgi:hypothetical protein